MAAFSKGLGGGAGIALSYALLGAFAIAISRSGVPEWLADRVICRVGDGGGQGGMIRYGLFAMIVLMAVASQNLVPVHIAFIPILIPPLLPLSEQ